MGHNPNTEDSAIEKPTLKLLKNLNWDEILTAFAEIESSEARTTGRKMLDEVVLSKYLYPALQKINVSAPEEAIDATIAELQRDRSVMSAVAANQEVYKLIKDGFKTSYEDENGERKDIVIRIIDWDKISNNSFVAISQFWVLGRLHKRRPDIIGFINGLPLIHIELKAPGESVDKAFHDNLRDYRDTIPQLFWYNQFIIISNGIDTKLGSMTASLEHFNEWKRIDSEDELGKVSLETTIRATCSPERALDIIENFVLFTVGDDSKPAKIIAKNHQYIGVNNAINALKTGVGGKLGVFWHTQGSGKSFSMIFFAQKTMRKLHGNWTFVIVTDRLDLDQQIYKNFARSGAVTETEGQARASSVADLRQKLKEDHRYLFTLIQKFQNDSGQPLEVLSDRDNIIVMTDEAHRTQYAVLALNMRNALPNARFLGFTGTPLIAEETERTKEVFGDYVSKYNFKQAVNDRSTVPLYYENRVPELQLTNEQFDQDMEVLLEKAALNEEQEKLLEHRLAKSYSIITLDSRLERVAQDIVDHFINRGYQGKAMVISIDRMTAVRTHGKVQKYWRQAIERLEARLNAASSERQKADLAEQIEYMRSTDMAVVVSSAQNEIDDFRQRGLDILPHRERMLKEGLEEKFKSPDDPLRIVFVCAMWITGFDAPSVSTIYLDKPMHGHALMQTIARANRVVSGKVNGLIVDYIGVFRDLQKALSIYSENVNGEMPVRDKSELLAKLKEASRILDQYLFKNIGSHLDKIHQTDGFERLAAIEKLVNAIVASQDSRREYEDIAASFNQLFKGILPDAQANTYLPTYQLLRTVEGQLHALAAETDIGDLSKDIENLLDSSIEAGNYTIKELQADDLIDLSQIDFEKLRKEFGVESNNIKVEKLRGKLDARLKRLIQLNKTRIGLADKFKSLIDDYNAGSKSSEESFDELMALARELDKEEQRAVREEMSEEELAIFDLIIRPSPNLTDIEVKQVKKTARNLLSSLKQHRLVLDWRKSQQNRAAVQRTIRDSLLEELPASYDDVWQKRKQDTLYEHFYEAYEGAGVSVYEGTLQS